MEYIRKLWKNFDEKFFARFDKRQKVYLAIFIGIILVLMWAFLSAAIITHNFNRSMLRNDTDKQDLNVKSMILTESQKGQKCWEIYGEEGEYSSDHKIAKLNNVIGNFYKENKVTMSFQTSRGEYDENTRVINMYENTYVVLENDISVIADSATYYSDAGIIKAKGHVKINRHNSFIATADEAIVNGDMTIFKIKGHTSSKVYEENKKQGVEKQKTTPKVIKNSSIKIRK